MPHFHELTQKDWIVLTKIAVSLFVLFVAAFVILSRLYPDDYIKWAFGVIGVVLGYWVK